ncbi:hypothetical protein CMI46_00230 [Candidatus Pacearchaeota archaeon]|nr:hypothetical protein [Candidatus Pacearchaeota archaeon]|tara:strand:+ start:1134 stop:1475 length:342 start_codon:yes stop_codon:yes gene_type:complete
MAKKKASKKVDNKVSKKINSSSNKKSQRVESLWRILVAIVAGIILYVWGYLIVLLAIANLIFTIFSGRRSDDLAMFCEYWNTEAYKYSRYLTGVSNIRPFPFSNIERISKFEK